jgi:hypothetical protein
MATLLEDIKKQSDWIVQAFAADKFELDYSVESFKSIDNFFDNKQIQKLLRGRHLCVWIRSCKGNFTG